jgi:hypothetical protein
MSKVTEENRHGIIVTLIDATVDVQIQLNQLRQQQHLLWFCLLINFRILLGL